jgi:O-antigen ligase
MLIFLSSIFIYFLIEKKIKIIFFFLLISTITIFLAHKYPLVSRLDVQLRNFAYATLELFHKAPKLFFEKNYNTEISGNTGYLIHFNSGIQIWKENKIFGKGLKSFPLNCKYGDNQTCNTHPHNYIIEIMLDTGLLGLIIIYSVFLIGLTNFLKFYFLKYNERIKLLTLPFFLIIFFEFFPFRSTGSFFTTSVSTIIFLFLAVFMNLKKIKNFYKM